MKIWVPIALLVLVTSSAIVQAQNEMIDDEEGTTIFEYVDNVSGDVIFAVDALSTRVDCDVIGSPTNVTMGFRAFVGDGYPGDMNEPSAVIKDLQFTYDFGEISYVAQVDDSEVPNVGNFNTSEWYTTIESYAYQASSIYDTKFGWRFTIEDPEVTDITSSPNTFQSALLLMRQDECDYNYQTMVPTMSMAPTSSPTSSPTPESPTPGSSGAYHAGMGGSKGESTYHIIVSAIIAIMASYIV